ncbi:metalloprotease [Coemansia sp. Benny D115]|nr:metalloprotease [Coemansia sp. Benny D115]
MDQIVKLASKFKNLDTFSVVLKDYPNGGPKAPDNNEVQQWKAKLKAYTSNVRTICIKRTRFPNSRRCVEFVVLMASILEAMASFNNPAFSEFPIPDWNTEFDSCKTVSTELPYEKFSGVIKQSMGDKNKYRLIRLPNNLLVACVQDSDAKQAAVSLSVNVGYFADPPELPGMAHFLEHMLFMGALDILSSIITDPLLNPNAVDREVSAVNSEFTGSITNEFWRTFRMARITSNPNHPYSKFNFGNIESLKGAAKSLGLDLHTEVAKFHKRYYSADIMKLVIVGSQGLDQLTEWAVSMFSGVESKGNTTPNYSSDPLTDNEFGKDSNDFTGIGMIKTPEEQWIITNIDKFKTTQSLVGKPAPVHNMIPKY